jgi:radical SAM superfamily enzyme YgiQ (UPF0313 family)
MKLGLIAMSGLRVVNPELAKMGLTLPGFIERKKVIASLPSLGLLTLAALTPPTIELKYIELNHFDTDDDLPGSFDIVAISSFTAQINSAYLLADKYRKNGAKVILGGLHVTALPSEAMQHADAIVIGEAEAIWPDVISDIQRQALKSVYDARQIHFDLSEAPLPKYELLEPEKYNRLTVQTQRGCPFACEFCASSILLSSKYKTKPITNIVNEINHIKSIWKKPFIELADDNTFANKIQAKKLIKALTALDIKWFTETDISIAENEDLLSQMSDSGCRQLLIGFESPTALALNKLEQKNNWKQRQFDHYLEAINRIQSKGISVNGCFILGLDGQDTSVFDQTFNFVKESGLSEVQITIQTPFPGSALYERLKREHRLLKQQFWDECTLFDVTYLPDKMTVGELETGFKTLMENIYSESCSRDRKETFFKQARKLKRIAS